MRDYLAFFAGFAWLAGIVCFFCGLSAGNILLLVAIALSVVVWAMKRGDKFELQEGEKILRNCRLIDNEDQVFFVRLTNQRMVLSAVEYPLLPYVIAIIVERVARPRQITYEWSWDQIEKVESSGNLLVGKTIVTTTDGVFHFNKSSKLTDFWNEQKFAENQ